ncbi:hypothetical protein [uncultured Acetatifactor sp.]|jgi:hypothetical protein|uniref:hypothetical protein n=1 Tax=uncultured Acetatifactor sp. TaxID=1671927 RepID=UPI0026038980|nr:hypothetical protein [uncultured Acetatifactor sp.]MCI9651960.1 hypothetical protein [Lachnospiraceae bacterium]
MKHKKSVMTVLILAMLGLSGCAENQIPDVSEEEMRAIGEYVAYTMVKYDVGHGSRLMDLPPVEEMDEQAPVPTRSPEETVGMDPVDDTPVVDASGEVVTDEGQSIEEPSYSAEEVMGLPEGVALSFAGQEICDSYPADSDYFAVTATEGKKLLVLKFSLTNTLEQETSVDLLSSQTAYRISVDGGRAGRALSTMLPNDMAFYADTLPAGASAEAVLIVMVDADTAESISSVALHLKNESKSHTIQLTSGE